jgi:predicted dehydrogenase
VGDEKLGVAVVGTGFGCLTHVRALRNAGFEVDALVGRDPARTAERAARADVAVAATSLAEALDLPGVVAVAVATPPHTHAPIVLEAISAGKHVVCEKPFTRDAEEARSLLAAADAAGVVHLLGTEFRFAPGQALMTRVVADGGIGDPRLATFLLHLPLLADPSTEVPDWWSDAAQGGGWLGAHGSHVVDQILVTLGPFVGVSAALPLVSEHHWTAEDSYSIRFTLRSGVSGIIQSSAGDWGPPLLAARIAGTKGTVWTEGETVMLADRAGTREVPLPDDLRTGAPDPPSTEHMRTAYDWMHSTGIDMGPYTRLFETFRDLILGRPVADDPRPATFADGVAGMEVLDAVRRSAATGGWASIQG